MKITLSHPTGNANVRAAAVGLAEAQLLNLFYSTIACTPGSLLHTIAGFPPFGELRRRTFEGVPEEKLKTWPWRETGRLLAGRVGFSQLTAHEAGIFSVDAVYRDLDLYVSKRIEKELVKSTGIYAYEDGAEYSFIKAKKLGLTCLYDLPIGHWRSMRKLLGEEREHRPEWASTLTGFRDSEEKLARKDKELELADAIFVASTFTARTLKDFPRNLAPVQVIPYGFPAVANNKTYSSSASRKLKLLFVGGLSQRKGIANLFEAVTSLSGHVELTVIGSKAVDDCEALNKELSRHRWIQSLPHSEILDQMRMHDVLVFPSLFEGFGLVITEAMSQGTPVITTDRTCGFDLIIDGENGWLVEAGSTLSLKNKIESILNNRGVVEMCGKAAMETAKARPWSVYGEELARAIELVLG
ncbi:glycosyltransferase family 4 protein [Pedobacter sp. SYSU D00535]|uniref:glycosyltransferase family 4 protein n=1 Tax=Pedobacter sp. SYSU D00535 TaxID=2810308 RepID=UPI001A96477C|nr:glycosyltransferase family 4 protein [Pedobacter sp. SYSU D00535]